MSTAQTPAALPPYPYWFVRRRSGNNFVPAEAKEYQNTAGRGRKAGTGHGYARQSHTQILPLQHRDELVQFLPRLWNLQPHLVKNIGTVEHHVKAGGSGQAVHASLILIRHQSLFGILANHLFVIRELLQIYQSVSGGQIDRLIVGRKKHHIRPGSGESGLHNRGGCPNADRRRSRCPA